MKKEEISALEDFLHKNKDVEEINFYSSLNELQRISIEATPNYNDEQFNIDVSFTYGDLKDKNFLGNLWFKHGYIDNPIENYINVTTELKTPAGTLKTNNPTVLKNGNINFAMVLPVTVENVKYLIEKTIEEYRGV